MTDPSETAHALDRRSLLGSGLMLAAVGTAGEARAAQASSTMPAGSMSLEQCIKSCTDSHVMCLTTARYCSQHGATHVAEGHLALLLDCAELCQTTANSLLRHSPQHPIVCDACARMCEACARDCAAFANDSQMQRCAATCRECAASCRDMARMPH